jgi:hypothetical protein
MANEQVKVPLFAASEILTAANMNLSAGTGVPVFATSVTRDSAFGGAGEKVLAEGQLCYLSDSNIVQYYTGAAWATVGPTSSGLAVVKAKTAFTTTTTFNADTVFSATYDNYLIQMVVNTTASNGYLSYRMRVGGVADSSANYTSIEAEAATSSISASTTSGATSGQVMYNFAAGLQFSNFIISQPATTNFTQIQSSSIRYSPGWSNIYGQHRVATAYDGIGFISAGNVTGYYTIYGYATA